MERAGRSPVVVIGGGIVGSAIAVHLADRGIPLVLVDQDWPGACSVTAVVRVDLGVR